MERLEGREAGEVGADELREEMGARWWGLLDSPWKRIPLAAALRIGWGRGGCWK